MDLRGIGPLTPPCHGGVLPVYHRPRVDLPRIELGTAQCECAGIPFTYKPALEYSSKGYFITKVEPKLAYYKKGEGLFLNFL